MSRRRNEDNTIIFALVILLFGFDWPAQLKASRKQNELTVAHEMSDLLKSRVVKG